MDYIEQLAWYVPVLSIAFVLLLTSINVYMRIRRRFAITVNCWFCQHNSRVAYDAANSWHCAHCDQYNGFTTDGDYNREIPAQRVAKMNAGQFAARARQPQPTVGRRCSNATPTTSNGLCAPCNLNQELKVQQLAAFEPLHPHVDYDTAVERYQQQLEQAYRLCARCERHLRRRLTRVKRTVLGSKLAQIGARGLSAFDMHISELSRQRGVTMTAKRRRLARLCAAMLIVLAVLAALRTGGEVQLTRSRLNRVLPDAVTRGVFVVFALLRTVMMCVRTGVERVWSATAAGTFSAAWLAVRLWSGAGVKLVDIGVEDIESASSLPAFDSDRTHCVAALMLCLLVAWVNRFRGGSLAVLIAWSVKSVLPWVAERLIAESAAESADSATYATVVMDMVRVLVDAVMVCTTIRDAVRRPLTDGGNTSRSNTSMSSHNNSSFHRIYTEADTGEVSDDNDNDTVFSASTTLSSGSPGSPSLDSTLSLSPSVFTPRTLRHSNTMLTSSVRSLNMSFGADTPAAPSLIRVPSATTMTTAASTATTPSRYHSMQALNSMCDVPDDFQSGITQLNISGFYPNKLNKTATVVSSAADNRWTSAAASVATRFGSYDQLRHRTANGCGSIIGPARLHAPSTIHEAAASQTTTAPANAAARSSWIAGGYWSANSTSPTKRTGDGHSLMADAGAAAPLMSRTSSQSSGFESRNDNDSRESSVGPTAGGGVAPATFASLAGDAFAATISPNDSVSQCGVGPWAEPPYQPAASVAATSTQYERFGTHRRSVVAAAAATTAAAAGKRWGAPPALPSQQQHHRAQSVFEPGSLLRSWQLRTSQLDISGRT